MQIRMNTCKNRVAVSAVWPTAISRKEEIMLCLSFADNIPSILSNPKVNPNKKLGF